MLGPIGSEREEGGALDRLRAQLLLLNNGSPWSSGGGSVSSPPGALPPSGPSPQPGGLASVEDQSLPPSPSPPPPSSSSEAAGFGREQTPLSDPADYFTYGQVGGPTPYEHEFFTGDPWTGMPESPPVGALTTGMEGGGGGPGSMGEGGGPGGVGMGQGLGGLSGGSNAGGGNTWLGSGASNLPMGSGGISNGINWSGLFSKGFAVLLKELKKRSGLARLKEGGGVNHYEQNEEVLRILGGYAKGKGSGRDDTIEALLSDGEYVMDAETVAMLGDGSNDEGAKRLDEMRTELRKHKGRNLIQGKFSADARKPLEYLSQPQFSKGGKIKALLKMGSDVTNPSTGQTGRVVKFFEKKGERTAKIQYYNTTGDASSDFFYRPAPERMKKARGGHAQFAGGGKVSALKAALDKAGFPSWVRDDVDKTWTADEASAFAFVHFDQLDEQIDEVMSTLRENPDLKWEVSDKGIMIDLKELDPDSVVRPGEMRGTSRGLDPDSVVRPGEMRTGKKFEAELARSRGEPIADPGTSRMPHGTKTMDILKKGWKPDRYRRGGRVNRHLARQLARGER